MTSRRDYCVSSHTLINLSKEATHTHSVCLSQWDGASMNFHSWKLVVALLSVCHIGHRDFKNLCEVLIKFKLVDCSYWDFLPSQLFDWETSCQLSLQQRLYVSANKRDKVYVYSMCNHSAATFPLTGQRAKGCLRPMAVGGTYCPIRICYNPLKPLGFSHQLIPKSFNPSNLLT